MFPKIGVPQNGWFIMVPNPIQMGCFWGHPYFWKHPYAKIKTLKCFEAPKKVGTENHQDGEYWPIRPLSTVTVWVALDRRPLGPGFGVVPRVNLIRIFGCPVTGS